MKFSLIFLAVLGVATAASVPLSSKVATKSLADDLDDFLALIDISGVLEIVMVYLAEDAEVQEAVEYLTSDEFKTLVLAIDAVPEYIEFLDYTQAAGLDIYKWVNLIHEIIGLEPLTRSTLVRRGTGVAGLINDLLAILPRAELRVLYLEKLQTSLEFAEFASRVNSDEFRVIVNTLREQKEYQDLRAKLEAKNVDIEAFVQLLKTLIGLA